MARSHSIPRPAPRAPTRHAAPLAVALLAGLAAVAAARPAVAAAPDTSRFTLEIGAGSDVTNEQFYEDAFVDTIALGRRLVNEPETRVAGLVRAGLEGTRDRGATVYRLQGSGALGNRARGGDLSLDLRHVVSSRWQWGLTPRAEYRRDETFDRDLEEARADGTARLRRMFPESAGRLDLTGRAEWFRTRGQGADFLPDRNAAGLALAYGRAPLFGPEWEAGYGVTRRVFPDSASRDHLEHRVGLSASGDLAGGHSIEGSADLTRRRTSAPAPTSRDNFREADLGVLATAWSGRAWGLVLRADAEMLRFDDPDSALFFDYDIVRLLLLPQRSLGSWTFRLGPRGELLESRAARDEEYRELAAVLEIECVPRNGWWSLSPVAGWRDYPGGPEPFDPATLPTPVTRSSYAFYELEGLVEQALPRRLRFRFYGSGRIERHTDRAQDATSLYISCEVRRLF